MITKNEKITKVTIEHAKQILKEAHAVKTMLDNADKHGDFGKDGYNFALLIHELLIASTALLVNVVEQGEVDNERE